MTDQWGGCAIDLAGDPTFAEPAVEVAAAADRHDLGDPAAVARDCDDFALADAVEVFGQMSLQIPHADLHVVSIALVGPQCDYIIVILSISRHAHLAVSVSLRTVCDSEADTSQPEPLTARTCPES